VPTTTVTTGGGGAKVAVGVGAALLVGGLGFLGFSLLKGDDAGAATPAEAGQQLFDALGDNDVLGELQSLAPGERELFVDISQDVSDEARRLGFLSDRFRLDGVDGLAIEVEGVEVDPDDDVEEITDGPGPDDGLAIVTIDEGTIRFEADGDALEGLLGDATNDLADATDNDLDVPDERDSVDLSDAPIPIAVVEHGGRWFPSLIATAFVSSIGIEEGGVDIDLADPDVEATGSDSPEDVLNDLLDAATEADARAALALLDPAEARLFQAAADDLGIPEDGEPTDFEAEITDFDVDDLGGGVHRVLPTAFTLEGEIDGGSIDIEFDGECLNLDIQPPEDEGDPLQEEICTGDDPFDALPEDVQDELEGVDVPEELNEILEAVQPIRGGFVTVERDGRHFLSPVRTIADVLLAFVRGVEPEDVQEGGILFRLFTGDLDTEFQDFEEALGDALGDSFFGTDEDFSEIPLPPDFPPTPDFPPIDEAPTDELPDFDPTGASGPNGELELGDVVAGSVDENGTVTFTLIGVADEVLVGVQGQGGFDPVIDVRDEATGELLEGGDNVDDTFGLDPEAHVTLEEGQRVLVEVHGFAGQPGDFNLYYQPVQ
jgi:hypothetical protein